MVERLLIEPARRRVDDRFVVIGALYPAEIAWPPNVDLLQHLAPSEHASFYCSSRLTLNTTRQAMVQTGYTPSGRLFEAASCGTPILSDWWAGLDEFFTPGQEILLARTAEEAVAALDLDDADLARIARAARDRTLACHTADVRAQELLAHCDSATNTAVPNLESRVSSPGCRVPGPG
jgi:spore maturation protein CgeB